MFEIDPNRYAESWLYRRWTDAWTWIYMLWHLRGYEKAWHEQPVAMAYHRFKMSRLRLARLEDMGAPQILIDRQRELVARWAQRVKERKVMEACRSCGADIFWKVHEKTRKPAPLNAGPDPKGNLALVGADRYRVVPADERDAVRAAGIELFVSHYSTCPNAPTWRSGRKA